MKQFIFISIAAAVFALAGCLNRPTQNPLGEDPKSATDSISIERGADETELRVLYLEIAHMDSLMFNAFNAHDMTSLKVTFAEDLEFYHDKGGLTNYQQTMDNFSSLFDRNRDSGLRRDLVAGSMEVYPIKDYGAVEMGVHKFCHTENGREDCGTFKFIHTWRKLNGQWKVTRVISYDH